LSYHMLADIRAFQHAFEVKPGPESIALYRDLIVEEFGKELPEAFAKYDADPENSEAVCEVIDAALDSVYVLLGLIYVMGIEPQPHWDEIQRANIDKIKHPCADCQATGEIVNPANVEQLIPCPTCNRNGHVYKIKRREDGKVLKPDNWRPPNHLPILERSRIK
jgi:predicted HAD superfamily Cof-like phosphohydrolase